MTVPLAIAVSIATLLLSGCGRTHETRRTEASSPPPIPVSIISVRDVAWPSTYEVPGTVRAVTATTLSSKIMGYVREVNVQPGDRVAAGQLLVSIDARDLEASLQHARAFEQEASSGIVEADNGIAAAKAQLLLAQVTFKRMDDLFNKRSISNQELDEAQARLGAAEASHQMAVSKRAQLNAKIAQANQAVESATIVRSYSEIRAPFAGIVTEKRAEPGQMASPGSPLLTIERHGAYRLEAAIEESMLAVVRLGQTVSVLIDSIQQSTSGKISEIVPAVDPSSRAFLVKVSLPPLPLLRTGLFGRIRLAHGSRQATVIPSGAILQRGALHSAFVVEDGTARMRMIAVGQHVNGQTEILSGLQSGEAIVFPTVGHLSDGAKVEVQP